MVACPQCGNEITEGSEICIHCGAKFNPAAGNGAENSANNPGSGAMDNPGGDDSGMSDNINNIKLNTSRLKLDLGSNSNSGNGNPGEPNGLSNPLNDSGAGQNPGTNPGTDNNSSGNSSDDAINDGSDTPTTKPSGKSPAQRSKWLEEQEKIKKELEALKGKVSKEFSVNSTLDLNEEDIFTLDDISEEEIQVASSGLVSRSRPLTPEEEMKKTELLSELNDLKAEGYDVSRLERIVNVDPTSAWNDFVKFMDDIEILQKLRKRYSEIDTTGFEAESQSIRKKLDNPDLILQIERELNDLETKMARGGGRSNSGGLDELIDAGKEAFRMMEYQKAMNFYDSALKIDPNNREVEFYKKKVEAKLQALSTMGPDTGAMAGGTYGGGGGYSPEIAGQIPMKRPTAPPAGGQPLQRRVRKVAPSGAPARRPVAAGGGGLQPRQVARKAPIPTGGNVAVKQPLSVSMTPKIPARKKVKVQPRAPTPAGSSRPRVMPVQRTGGAPGSAPYPAPAPAPAPAPVSPADAAKLEGLGFNAFINKDYAKALEYYEQVLAINPNYPGAASQRDKCLEALGMR